MHTASRPLPWPASRIDREVLHELWREAQRTGTPITVIIKTAVEAHLTALLLNQAEAPPTAQVA